MKAPTIVILGFGAVGIICATASLWRVGRFAAPAAPAPSIAVQTAVMRELAAATLRDGWAALRGGQFGRASDAAAIASIFGDGDGDGASALLAASIARRERRIASLDADARDAVAAGDGRRAQRAVALVERLVASSPTAVSPPGAAPAPRHDGDAAAIDEARRHVRAGSPAQARASLLETAGDGESARVRELLVDIGRTEASERVPGEEVP